MRILNTNKIPRLVAEVTSDTVKQRKRIAEADTLKSSVTAVNTNGAELRVMENSTQTQDFPNPSRQ